MARNTYEIDERLESPFNASHLFRSLLYVKKHAIAITVAFLLSIAVNVINLFTPYLSMVIIDEVIPAGDLNNLLIIAVLYLSIYITTYLLNYLHSVLMNRTAQKIVFDLRQDLFAHIQELPFEYFDNRPAGKILVRVVNYVQNVADFLSGGLINIVIQLLNIIFILIFMFRTNVELSFVILAGVPFLILFLMLTKKQQRFCMINHSNKSSNLNAYLAESIDGVKITQTFDRQKKNLSIFNGLSLLLRKAWMKWIYINHLIPLVTENLAFWMTLLVYGLGAVVFGNFKLGVIVAMASYAARFWTPIQSLGNIYNQIMNVMAYLERIFETMDEPVTLTDKEDAAELPEIKGAVEFKNVTFGYDEGVNVLENLSFRVEAGQSVALVGPTGAGKTTIVNLLSRFYDINEGEILIDGINIRDVTMKSLRRQMGVMLQDTFIFSGSIRENIRYGRLDATDEEIIEAAKAVKAHNFISEREKGYDTEVSERGQSLSAGQRQLVSFARTLLSDPKILILDEATSSIDTETEVLLQEGIQSLLKNRTSFIIAHRLSTIRSCDKIFYISDKGIAESGTHDELMAKKGLYYELCMSQIRDMS